MGIRQNIINDSTKILKCHLDKDAPDWDLFVRQVNAMDKKYKKHERAEYEYMQKCMKVVANTLQMVGGELYGETG